MTDRQSSTDSKVSITVHPSYTSTQGIHYKRI